jgi:hypothetical protein
VTSIIVDLPFPDVAVPFDLTRGARYLTPVRGYLRIQRSNVRIGTLFGDLLRFVRASYVLANAFHFGRMR